MQSLCRRRDGAGGIACSSLKGLRACETVTWHGVLAHLFERATPADRPCHDSRSPSAALPRRRDEGRSVEPGGGRAVAEAGGLVVAADGFGHVPRRAPAALVAPAQAEE